MAAKTNSKQVAPSRSVTNMKFFTPEGLAEFLKIQPATLTRWRYSRQGPEFVKVGGLVRYEHSAVEEWLQQRTRDTGQRL